MKDTPLLIADLGYVCARCWVQLYRKGVVTSIIEETRLVTIFLATPRVFGRGTSNYSGAASCATRGGRYSSLTGLCEYRPRRSCEPK